MTNTDTIDDAADTLRMRRIDLLDEAPTDPDATSIYDLTPAPARYVGTSRQATRRRRMIRDTRENIVRLREALAEGWDIGPELLHEEQKLATLEETPC